MTREEAIKVLQRMKYPYKCNKRKMIISNVDRDNEALDMAIQALSQEPCDDAISREEVLDLLATRVPNPYYENVFRAVDELPPVTQKSGVEPQESEDKCKNCEYYHNPDYTRCHECKAESEDKE